MSLGVLCPGQGDLSPAMFALVPVDGVSGAIMASVARMVGRDPRGMDANRLATNAIAQPVLCGTQMALWSALRDHLPLPAAFAGYSVGELAAHGCAGTFDPGTVLRLAATRAALMDHASPVPGGLMAVRGLLRPALAEMCAPLGLEIAIVNDVDRLVVGGPVTALDVLEPRLAGQGAKVTRLKITIASHTSPMRRAAPAFLEALRDAGPQSAGVPVLDGLTGQPLCQPDQISGALAAQLSRPIAWSACMDGLLEMGCSALLELGPGNGLSRMVRDRFPEIPTRSVSEFQSLNGVVDWVERIL